ncbi:pyridoxal 5'-phosphate synthase [Streptomyces sp. NPDC059637]|uniref:pyridoxine/pyridoxamine 5'-phosphate oxidase n=1 Tax=Streptomyces sp. NPDC059637 TaxID=3347752 RepID=UPI0036BF09B2
MEADESLRSRLLRAPALAGPLPPFDTGWAPERPGELFVRWIGEALDAGTGEPQVMTLSTADRQGRPSARVLLLRDVDVEDCGFVFATSSASRKGRELADNPRAALTWYWPAQGRQVRVTGRVETAPPRTAREDFLGRSPASREAAFTGRTSAPLSGAREYEHARARAREHLAADPLAVPPDHTVCTVRADEIEFWQGSADRHHVRLRYLREGDGWTRGLLWP